MSGPIRDDGREITYGSPELHTEHPEDAGQAERRMTEWDDELERRLDDAYDLDPRSPLDDRPT